jgi:hypothetical protein
LLGVFAEIHPGDLYAMTMHLSEVMNPSGSGAYHQRDEASCYKQRSSGLSDLHTLRIQRCG